MSNLIKCPHCGMEQTAPDDPIDYDFESGASLYGRVDVPCLYCSGEIELEAHFTLLYVDVLNEGDSE